MGNKVCPVCGKYYEENSTAGGHICMGKNIPTISNSNYIQINEIIKRLDTIIEILYRFHDKFIRMR